MRKSIYELYITFVINVGYFGISGFIVFA